MFHSLGWSRWWETRPGEKPTHKNMELTNSESEQKIGGWLRKRWLLGRAQGSENISGYEPEVREGLRTEGVACTVEFCGRVRADMP